MTKKIFRSIICVAGIVLFFGFIIIISCLYSYFGNIQEKQLVDDLNFAAIAVENNGQEYLESLHSERYRLTWIDCDGTVIYDTVSDSLQMENHADREEILLAKQTGIGKSTRYSSTLLEKTLYYAKKLDDGTILRISTNRATAAALSFGILQPILIILFIAFLLSFFLAKRVSKRITEPLNQLDLERPLENDTYEELSPLLRRIHQQRQQIQQQMSELQKKSDEFTMITQNMKEGLVLLNEKGVVLSINRSAQRLFGADSDCLGRDFLTIDRSFDIDHAIHLAFAEGHKEIHTERKGRVYQLDISRISSDNQIIGAVLLAFDVTEQVFAERNRREFTANVSHELKTPLQSIMGSAELMENGLVKPEDMPRFIGHIRKEASRLVTLIQDIIHLSQLDEETNLPMEDVSLYPLAEEIVSDLQETAAAKGVSLKVTGEDVTMNGVRHLLHEILFNLCDNAIKYNVENGAVNILLAQQGDNAVITIKDSGIGIPPEHQERVFERFYRVDKSHSKESGGTGLGLSIVKHAVQYMKGTIALTSEVGKGTVITLTFPQK